MTQPPSFQPSDRNRRKRNTGAATRPGAACPTNKDPKNGANRPPQSHSTHATVSDPSAIPPKTAKTASSAGAAMPRSPRVSRPPQAPRTPELKSPIEPQSQTRLRHPNGLSTPPSFAPARGSAPRIATSSDGTSGAKSGITSAQQPAAYAPNRQRVPQIQPQLPRVIAQPSAHNAQSGNPARPYDAAGTPLRKKRKLGRKLFALMLVLTLIMCIAWPIGLIMWANGHLHRVSALSSMPAENGTTYLVAGSDARSDGKDGGIVGGPNDSQRTDTIILVHWSANGQKSMVSIPRDTAVNIPGHGIDKINSSYFLGGPQLLVKTVEEFTGIKIDHYIEVTMGGVTQLVNAVGGINLCYNRNVNDEKSELVWASGCHDVNGKVALAFSRMRYSDPEGDIGRTKRQRQVISKVVEKATELPGALSPFTQLELAKSGTSLLTTDRVSTVTDLGWLALAFKSASKDGLSGIPPVSSLSYREGGHGAKVLIKPEDARKFFSKMRAGTLTPNDYQKEQNN